MNDTNNIRELFKDRVKNNDVIFEQYKSLVYDIALKKYHIKSSSEREEIISEGFIGLQKAIKGFNVDRSNKFISFAYSCIINEINMYLRRYNRCYRCTGQNMVSLSTPLTFNQKGDVENLYAGDTIESGVCFEDEVVEEMMKDLVCKDLLQKLTLQEKELIQMYYLEEKTQKEISEKIGITQSAISRKIRKAIKKIKSMNEVK